MEKQVKGVALQHLMCGHGLRRFSSTMMFSALESV